MAYSMALSLLIMASAVVTVVAQNFTCPEICACSINNQDLNVDCSERNLTGIPEDIPPDTATLNLAGNTISTINSSHFVNFTQLKSLDMSNCQLEHIGNNSFLPVAPSLEELILVNNLLSTIDDEMFAQLQLNRLSLSDNVNLVNVSSRAFVDSSIKHLDINNCHLTAVLNGTLDPLKDSLEGFSLSNNRAPNLLLSTRMLAGFQLSYVTLNNNSLTDISSMLGSACRILEFNDNNVGNSALDIVDKIDGLEELFVSNVGINEVTFSLTSNYTLYVLDISKNQIANLDVQQFKYLPVLATLNVMGNQLTSLSNEFSKYLPGLIYLDLSYNKLLQLKTESLKNLNLKLLDLTSNKIQTIPSDMVNILENLQTLKVESNPLHCNCEMLWFAQWVRGRTLGQTDVIVDNCVTPKVVPLLNLRDMEFTCTVPMLLFVKPPSIEVGKEVSLYCKAKGDPPPKITISSSSASSQQINVEPHANKTDPETEAVYSIAAFACDADFGEYTCTASSFAGLVNETLSVNQTSLLAGSNCSSINTSSSSSTTTTSTTTVDPRGGESKDTGLDASSSSGSIDTGVLIVIIVCVVALFILLVVIAYCFWQKKTRQSYELDEKRNGKATKVHYTNEGADVSDKV